MKLLNQKTNAFLGLEYRLVLKVCFSRVNFRDDNDSANCHVEAKTK